MFTAVACRPITSHSRLILCFHLLHVLCARDQSVMMIGALMALGGWVGGLFVTFGPVMRHHAGPGAVRIVAS